MPVPNDRKLDVTFPSDREIRMTRTFDAAPELVFRAWTEPKYVTRWWICPTDGSSMTKCEVDLRVGGHWHWVSKVGEHAFGFFGTYREIERPNRIVYSENFDPTAQHQLDTYEPDDPNASSLVVLELVERNGQTFMVSTASYASKEVRDFVLSTGMADGAALALDRLDEIIATELRSAA